MKRAIIPALCVAVLSLFGIANYVGQLSTNAFELDRLGKLPVSVNHHTMPMDTLSREWLKAIHRNSNLKGNDGNRLKPIEWFAEALFAPERAKRQRVFAIANESLANTIIQNNPSRKKEADRSTMFKLVGNLFGSEQSSNFFSFDELAPLRNRFDVQSRRIQRIPRNQRTDFQNELADLSASIDLFDRLTKTIRFVDSDNLAEKIEELKKTIPIGMKASLELRKGMPYDALAYQEFTDTGFMFERQGQLSAFQMAPGPSNAEDSPWLGMESLFTSIREDNEANQFAMVYAGLSDSYSAGDADGFSEHIQILENAYQQEAPESQAFARRLQFTNLLEPLYITSTGYLIGFVFSLIYWLRAYPVFYHSAFGLVTFSFFIQTLAIALQANAYLTTSSFGLHGSTIAMAWFLAFAGLVIEGIFKNGIGFVSAIGAACLTMIVAYSINRSNGFDLQQHVDLEIGLIGILHILSMSAGHSLSILASSISCVFIIFGLRSNRIDKKTRRTLRLLAKCCISISLTLLLFGLLFGVPLSMRIWGYFWNWDPKANSVLIIILWQITVLIAIKSRIVKGKSLFALIAIGNVFTTWSWLGLNLLGLGVHSHGSIEGIITAAAIFTILQILVALTALTPAKHWKSGAHFA